MQGINTESFPTIWAKLSEEQRYSLGTALVHEKCCTTRQTVWNWANSKTQPVADDVKTHVANVVRKTVGLRVLPHTLFPAK